MRIACRALLAGAAALSLLPASAVAQPAAPHIAPESAPLIGQVSKDSVWVPTPERVIRRMLQLADVTPADLVIDLGSGDGRIPIHAAKHFGARAVGVELEENLVRLSERAARDQGVAGLARFLRQDLFEADLSQASVIALYISPGVMAKLRPRLLALRPGTRVVSHHFDLGDWEPDETLRSEGRNAFLWIVPADVRGSWRVDTAGDGLRLHIGQAHQLLTMRAERAGRAVPLLGARLRGAEIRFSAFDPDGASRQYVGRVEAGRMQGNSDGSEAAPRRWSATRE